MEDLLGPTLLDAQNNPVPTSSLAGSVFDLYFSAHWCPPCRMFTPKLAEWYANFASKHPDKKLSLIFVSSDKDPSEFAKYRSEMNFHALPYEERERKSKLSSTFKVRGIPTLLIFDEQGSLITSDGRDIVSQDREGNDYPWRPKPFAEEMEGPLMRHGGPQTTYAELAASNKLVAFYFSAHWCPPCQAFTPVLVEAYKAMTARGLPLEVVFVSSDNLEREYNKYLESMPWLALPFDDKRRDYLEKTFEVDGIPTVVLTDGKGKVLRADLREVIATDPQGEGFPFKRKALASLEASLGTINDVPTLVVFTDKSAAQTEQAKAALAGLAAEEELYASEHGEQFRLFLAYTTESDENNDKLRKFLSLSEASPLLVYIDISNAKKYVREVAGELTAEAAQEFVKDVRAGTAPSKGVRE